jgi:hypothetical protein
MTLALVYCSAFASYLWRCLRICGQQRDLNSASRLSPNRYIIFDFAVIGYIILFPLAKAIYSDLVAVAALACMSLHTYLALSCKLLERLFNIAPPLGACPCLRTHLGFCELR